MLCTQQELLHSTLQLSLQSTSSLRKCQQPTGADAQALPSPAPRQNSHQREAARTFPGPSSGGRDPQMTRSGGPETAADPQQETRLLRRPDRLHLPASTQGELQSASQTTLTSPFSALVLMPAAAFSESLATE